ncbi:uncharacterized protein ABDE67_000815 [Symphorus nematophorus]
MCKTCPQIYATLKKLNKHSKEDHNETVANTATKKPKSAPRPSAVIKNKLSKIHSSQVSVSKASFLSKKKPTVFRCQQCSYGCTTKLGLSRHMHFRHNSASVSKAQDSLFKCALCSSSYSRKKHLGSHYKKKHGKEAFLKYYAPYKQVHKKPAPTVPECTSTEQPENTSEACKSSMTAEKNKIFVYKCPSCPYVNASYHGTLTHCQMQHPDLVARADELETDEILVTNMVGCKVGKNSNERGYMCEKCPQIHVSLKKLKIHCEKDHCQAKAAASELSVETETKNQPDLVSQSSLCSQDELPLLETVDELAQWKVTPVETLTLPASPLSSPSKPTDVEQPELESREDDKHTCKQCRRSFNSLKGLRSHERSHAALAAIKKVDVLSTPALKHK